MKLNFGGLVLQHLESRLNGVFTNGKLQPAWRDVVGVDPSLWRPDPSLPQKTLTEDELKQAVKGCWFPVYAFGYNWLQSNGDSAKAIATRIREEIKVLSAAGFECPKVIIITHSMGGMVGRALIHPDYGGLKDQVLGIVHGAQPATGAAAAYRRMRAGFEDPGLMSGGESSIAAKVAGNMGDEVTAVLANSPGGLQLLPGQAYGNDWLQVTHKGNQLAAWPKNGDPYGDIYKMRGKWYSLIREEWINPADRPSRISGWYRTQEMLGVAKDFHGRISGVYHECSYAHYGADPERLSFGNVVWDISKYCDNTAGWENWPILADTRQGCIDLVQWEDGKPNWAHGPRVGASTPQPIRATILPPTEFGDQTVPIRSSDHQLQSGKFKGVFRQRGYEHQDSYKDPRAIASTLYSIVRIAQQAKWKGC